MSMMYKKLKAILATAIALFMENVVSADTPIPEIINVGTYSVKLKVPDNWRVEVYDSKGVVKYKYSYGRDAIEEAVEIAVYRIKIPADMKYDNIESLADRLIRDDEMKIHRVVFGEQRSLRFDKTNKVQSELGFTRHYIFNREYRDTRSQYFAQISIIFDKKFSENKEFYLLTGYEVNHAKKINPEWIGLVNELVKSIRKSG